MSRIKPIWARLARTSQRSQSKPLERAGPDLPAQSIYISRNQQKEYEYLNCVERRQIKLEAQLDGGKFDGWKISEVPISSTSIFLQASKMFFILYRGTKLYKARNIFRIHIVVIKVILRNFFVETMKITPFNGSIILRTQRHFLLVPLKNGFGSLKSLRIIHG
jgi:hypothetical protein